MLHDAPEHGGGCGDADEGLGDVRPLLEVADEASVFDQPAKGALNHPSARQRLKARHGMRSLDDRQREVGLLLRPGDELAGIAAIGEHDFDEVPQTSRSPQHRFGAVPILHAGRLHLHAEQAAIGVGQDVSLAPRDLLARVVAARAPF